MRQLGAKLTDVWFYDKRNSKWVDERHVDDDDTFLDTVDMTFERMGWKHAIWDVGDGWCSLSKRTGETKSWPSRAAAEMAVIHAK